MLWLFLVCALAIVAIWGGYPVAVALLASARGKRRPVSNVAPVRVSVIIATAEPAPVVRERVRDVLDGDYPAGLLDVVVGVDHGASADVAQFAGTDPRVTVVRGDAPGGKAAALNAAVRVATGEVLVFTDSAQRFERSAIRVLVEALADPSLGAVSGALHIGRDGAPASLAERYWIYEKWLRLQEARLHSTVGVTGAVYALRRRCWNPLPAGLILDDVYVPMRVVLSGLRVGFEPGARAYDDRRFAPAQEFRRKARTLTGVLQLCAWLPAILVPWRNRIWAQFLFHKLLRLATPYLLLGAAVGLAGRVGESLLRRSPSVALGVFAVVLGTGALLLAAIRPLRGAVQMAVAMQVAAMRATVNAMRGEWDVWRR